MSDTSFWSSNYKCCCFIIWIEKEINCTQATLICKTPCNNVETNDLFEFDVRVNILIGKLKQPYFVSTDMKIDEGRNVWK